MVKYEEIVLAFRRLAVVALLLPATCLFAQDPRQKKADEENARLRKQIKAYERKQGLTERQKAKARKRNVTFKYREPKKEKAKHKALPRM